MKALIRPLVPGFIRRLRDRGQTYDYQRLYDEQARNNADHEVVGDGPYDTIGRMQLELLTREGLKPQHTLVDFGCGNGRLAVHAIPFLNRGRYFGIDICQEFLRRAEVRTGSASLKDRVRWLHQTTTAFPAVEFNADMLCAFSVFTHMEHEDAYRYLVSAKQVVKPCGRFIFSCLPLDQVLSRQVFEAEAAADLQQRWSRVRNVVTSKEMMCEIASMAGWQVVRWYDGDSAVFAGPAGSKISFGQSACVLTTK